MLTITDDNILLFSDIHIGIRSNSITRLNVAETVIDEIIDVLNKRKIKTVIFTGDWHHERPSINVETMCKSINMIKRIAKLAKIYFILGNHDIANNISTDVTSVKFLEDIDNVVLINKPTEFKLGNRLGLMCPWLTDFSQFNAETYDVVFGHFDISSKYLIESYVEEHITEKISKTEVSNIMIKSGYEFQPTDTPDDEILDGRKCKSSKHLGTFVDICKKGGRIFSGHIHTRKTFTVKGRKFTFLGSPLQLTWGDCNSKGDNSDRGFYILNNETLKLSFRENTTAPIHRKYFISELPLDTTPIEKIFLGEHIAGNYVRLILNKQFDFVMLGKIINLINSFTPMEPCVVDYDFSIDFDTNSESISTGSMKVSKLEYIQGYVENLDDDTFNNFSVDRNEIITYLKRYFEITEESLG
jgi:predicted phosphodiesterase